MQEKKTGILAILDILKEHSDENHLLSQKEIADFIRTKYNLDFDRRTIYDNISKLKEFGYDIETFEDNRKGYCLRERDFESSEVFLLCNAIHASNMLPQKNSKDLIDKLLNTQSKYVKENFHTNVFLQNTTKKENKQFFLNIELLAEAIKNHHAISFDYTKYNLKKEVVNRREEKYTLSPYYLVYANEKTYLIGKLHKHEGLTHFRVDKIKNIDNTELKYEQLDNKQDPYQYAKTKVYMYSGEGKVISIKCDMSILDDIFDRFGLDIMIYEDDENHFIANIKGNEEGMKYFALQYIEHLEVLEPLSLRESIKQSLNEGTKKYA